MKKRIISMVLVLTLVLTMLPAMTVAALAETINDDEVFVKQSSSGKCVLASAVMMLRRRAIIDGSSDWASITESTLSKSACDGSGNMYYSFSFRGMNVSHDTSYNSMSLSEKKTALIKLLAEHPEGFVIWDDSMSGNGSAHAVLLTDYDEDSNTFYCADPASGVPSGRIKLSQSWNAKNTGGTQDGVISGIYKIWYITNKSGAGPGLVKVTLNANGGTCSTTCIYVSADGTLGSLPTPVRDGFKFMGWYDAPAGGNKISENTLFKGDTTVYAQWKDLTVRGTAGSLTWSLNPEVGTLYISGSGEMPGYPTNTELDAPWYQYADSIKKVEIASGVKNVGDFAFADLTKLTAVTINGSVQKLGRGAFSGCTALSQISGISSVKVIDEDCFRGCTALSDINIPAACTVLGRYAFAQTGIKSVSIPYGMTAIGEGAFSGCKALKKAELPSTLLKLGSDCFRNCTALEAVLPASDDAEYVNGQMKIDTNAFSGCTALRELNIYTRAESLLIAFNAFSGCTALQSVSLDCRSLSLENNAFPKGAQIYYVRVNGEYGSIAPKAFEGVTTSIIYPSNGTAWASHKGEQLGGTLTWESWDNHMHEFKTLTIAPTCSEQGYTVYTCKSASCSESFQSNYKKMLGHSFVNGVCTLCGAKNPFSDIDAKGEHIYYTDAILWAAETGITTGITSTTFEPDSYCTRAQVVTFLWRMAGSPEPNTAEHPFKDIKAGEYYYKAVLWAVENGITTGITGTTFEPDGTCTRAQIVMFLWRYFDKPASGGEDPFTDVQRISWFYEPVLWAAQTGITQGNGNGTFLPDDTCTRAQVATFMYRSQNLK